MIRREWLGRLASAAMGYVGLKREPESLHTRARVRGATSGVVIMPPRPGWNVTYYYGTEIEVPVYRLEWNDDGELLFICDPFKLARYAKAYPEWHQAWLTHLRGGGREDDTWVQVVFRQDPKLNLSGKNIVNAHRADPDRGKWRVGVGDDRYR
jgi:hypothetical protein